MADGGSEFGDKTGGDRPREHCSLICNLFIDFVKILRKLAYISSYFP